MIRNRILPALLTLPACLGLLLAAGCDGFGGKKLPPEPAPKARGPGLTDDELFAGTISAETFATQAQPKALRGFGLVIGLNGRGSRDCPTAIREYLIEYLTKQIGPMRDDPDRKRMTPAEMIDSPDTAVVEVLGMVPGGARKGARFDLEIRALAGTSTGSLEGGMLLKTPMRIFDRGAADLGLRAGSVLAEGAGPVFVDPLNELPNGVLAAQAERIGRVMGGGQALEEHVTRLVLRQPNYLLAQAIERRINERFGHQPRTAEAMSAGYLELHTPMAYARDPERFRSVAAHLMLENRPDVLQRRRAELVQRLIQGGGSAERISYAWEALGREVVPDLQPLYLHPEVNVRFYAARAGLRLDDLSALSVLGAIAAADVDESFRLSAIRELAVHASPQCSAYLTPLVNDADVDVRIAAYEAMVQRGHAALRSETIPHLYDSQQINLVLDVVDSSGPPLIYVRRSRLPRIAIFGSRMLLNSPVFYAPDGESVTVHTVDGTEDLRLYAKQRGRMSTEIVFPPRVVELVGSLARFPEKDATGRLRGVGLPYSRVVKVLAALAQDQTLPGPVVPETAIALGLPDPTLTPERSETDRPMTDPDAQEVGPIGQATPPP